MFLRAICELILGSASLSSSLTSFRLLEFSVEALDRQVNLCVCGGSHQSVHASNLFGFKSVRGKLGASLEKSASCFLQLGSCSWHALSPLKDDPLSPAAPE